MIITFRGSVKTLLDEYSALLENSIERMKREYSDFVIYIMAITTEENHNRSYISFDLKENSLKRLQEWEKEYSYRIEAIYRRTE